MKTTVATRRAGRWFTARTVWMPTWRFCLAAIVLALALVGAGWAGGARPIAAPLVEESTPAKADLAIVEWGAYPEIGLVRRAARLFRQNRVGHVALLRYQDSPRLRTAGIFVPQRFDDVLAVYWREAGLPDAAVSLIPVDVVDPVTLNVARQAAAWCRLRAVHSVVIITATLHSRRSAMCYRKVFAGSEVTVFATSPDGGLSVENWWQTKDGIQAVLLEWTRMFYYRIVLL